MSLTRGHFRARAQHALLHYVFGRKAIADHQIGAAEQHVGSGRDEVLELNSGAGSPQRLDARRRVHFGLLIIPLNPCGDTEGSIAWLAPLMCEGPCEHRKRLRALRNGVPIEIIELYDLPARRILGFFAKRTRDPQCVFAAQLALTGDDAVLLDGAKWGDI